MNHTGVRRTGSPRAARTRSESAGLPGATVEGAGSTTGDPPIPPSDDQPGPISCGASDAIGASWPYPANVEPHSVAGSGDASSEPPAAFRAVLESLEAVRPRQEI